MRRYTYPVYPVTGTALVQDKAGKWVLYEEAQGEIVQLRGRIPTGADGEPVFPEDVAFVRHDDGTIESCVVKSVFRQKVEWEKPDLQGYIGARLSRIYKTHQAAEQVGIADREARRELTIAIHSALHTGKLNHLRFIVNKYGLTQEKK